MDKSEGVKVAYTADVPRPLMRFDNKHHETFVLQELQASRCVNHRFSGSNHHLVSPLTGHVTSDSISNALQPDEGVQMRSSFRCNRSRNDQFSINEFALPENISLAVSSVQIPDPEFKFNTPFNTDGSHIDHPIHNSSDFQDQNIYSALHSLKQNMDLQEHFDFVSACLSAPPILWSLLYAIRQFPNSRELLGPALPHMWNVPIETWKSVADVRNNCQFEQMRDQIIGDLQDFMSLFLRSRRASLISMTPSSWELNGQDSDRTDPSEISQPLYSPPVVRPDDRPACDDLPSFSNPQPWKVSQSYRRRKRAPPGQLFFCPVGNCSAHPFKNRGNYLRHMHLEHPHYPDHDPAKSLREETEGENYSVRSRNGSSSPLSSRRMSVDQNGFHELTLSTSRSLESSQYLRQ